MINSVCIFCGARFGDGSTYRTQAEEVGRGLARHGIEIVYGGGHVGLMGVVADAAMKAGGKVTGYIPTHLLELEVGHRAISELVETDSMFARKEQMIDRADAFVILPGGLGTLDEFFEVLTLSQLNQHKKPIIIVNVDGFWDPLISLIQKVVSTGFAGDDVLSLFRTVGTIDDLLPTLGLESGNPSIQAVS